MSTRVQIPRQTTPSKSQATIPGQRQAPTLQPPKSAPGPHAGKGGGFSAGIASAPRVALQRKRIHAAFGHTIQRQARPEKELLQGKFSTLQGQALEEEELLQGKRNPVQRQAGPEDEELLQGKFHPIQRQGPEDEELQMMKAPSAPTLGQPDPAAHTNTSGLPAQLNALAYAQGSVKPTTQRNDGAPVIIPPPTPQPSPIKKPEPHWIKEWEKMKAEARAYIDEFIREKGYLPGMEDIFEPDRHLPYKGGYPAGPVIKPPTPQPIRDLHAKFQKTIRDAPKYANDPNGRPLARKRIQNLEIELGVLERRYPSQTGHGLLAWMRRTLGAMMNAVETMKEDNREQRIQELGRDIRRGVIRQEGEIGADIELQYGGLTRSVVNELEYEPGILSHYRQYGQSEHGVWGPRPGDMKMAEGGEPLPGGLDAFGLTADVMPRIISTTVREYLKNALLGSMSKKKARQYVKKLDDESLRRIWDQVVEHENAHVEGELNVNRAELLDVFMRGHFQQLKDHLHKARIVPLDRRGYTKALLAELERLIKTLPREDQQRIHWYG